MTTTARGVPSGRHERRKILTPPTESNVSSFALWAMPDSDVENAPRSLTNADGDRVRELTKSVFRTCVRTYIRSTPGPDATLGVAYSHDGNDVGVKNALVITALLASATIGAGWQPQFKSG